MAFLLKFPMSELCASSPVGQADRMLGRAAAAQGSRICHERVVGSSDGAVRASNKNYR
jgi:hypothetical protein